MTEVQKAISSGALLKACSSTVFDRLPSLVGLRVSMAIADVVKHPYRDLENRHSVIFVHVPKAAGNGVTTALFGQLSSGHYPLVKYQRADPDKYRAYYKFAFVRNPWDRMLSAYVYLKQGGIGVWDHRFADKYLRQVASFGDFVRHLSVSEGYKKAVMSWLHFRPQMSYLRNSGGTLGDLNFVGRVENLASDLEVVAGDLGRKLQGVRRVNTSNHGDYRSFYDDEMVEIVGNLYRDDIEGLGYGFG